MTPAERKRRQRSKQKPPKYEVVDIDLFRTRIATGTQEQMREEVVVLKWSGQMPAFEYPFSDRPL